MTRGRPHTTREVMWFSALAAVLAIGIWNSLVALRPSQRGSSREPAIFERLSSATLIERFGKEKYSQGPEEWLIRDFFNDERGGVFVDVGSWDSRALSNTYRLEKDLGWTGLAIDAQAEFGPGYELHRPNTRFIVAFVGDKDEGQGLLYVYNGSTLVASGRQDFTQLFGKPDRAITPPNRRLDSILEAAGIGSFDFLSIDIELSEPAALRGFAIDRHRPRLVCIEAQGETRQFILEYFAQSGYVLVGDYLRIDNANLYFKPMTGSEG